MKNYKSISSKIFFLTVPAILSILLFTGCAYCNATPLSDINTSNNVQIASTVDKDIWIVICVLSIFFVALILSFILPRWARYKATSLNNLSLDIITDSSTSGNVQIASKSFNKADCKKYLDRAVIKKGYQPVQIFIQNNSSNSYLFSPNRISLPCARADEVTSKVHTSTVGRATGYGVGALFIWPLAIRAIIDGVRSSNANQALDNDFACKIAKERTLFPS